MHRYKWSESYGTCALPLCFPQRIPATCIRPGLIPIMDLVSTCYHNCRCLALISLGLAFPWAGVFHPTFVCTPMFWLPTSEILPSGRSIVNPPLEQFPMKRIRSSHCSDMAGAMFFCCLSLDCTLWHLSFRYPLRRYLPPSWGPWPCNHSRIYTTLRYQNVNIWMLDIPLVPTCRWTYIAYCRSRGTRITTRRYTLGRFSVPEWGNKAAW